MSQEYCILIHYHEIALKGKNRKWFESQLIKNIKLQLNGLPYSKINLSSARIFCFGIDSLLWEEYSNRLNKIIGVKYSILVSQIKNEIELIKTISEFELKNEKFSSFRISARRQHKDYHLTSQEVNAIIGQHIQSVFLKPVDLDNADINLIIEIVKGMAYIGYKKISGYGGLPIKTGERAVSMISSGIDSPVASFKMLKRGVDLTYVHFHSSPATSQQSIQNVEEILIVLSQYQIKCDIYMIPLLDIQQKIMSESPNKMWVILFRRAMIKLSSMIAKKINAPALVSGESVGQVASQTLSNIRATSDATTLPIIRPLAGSNKEDIINIAEKIGTYEISIEPYDDCCSFFVPIHPETKANLENVIEIEEKIDFNNLFIKAINESTVKSIQHPNYINNSNKKMEPIND